MNCLPFLTEAPDYAIPVMVEAPCTWEKLCAGTWPNGTSSLWLGLLWICKEIHGRYYDILMGYQSISPGSASGFIILTLFLKICLSSFKGYSMSILVAVRDDSLCHLPKSTGLLLTSEGEVKAVLSHFSPLPTLGCCKH